MRQHHSFYVHRPALAWGLLLGLLFSLTVLVVPSHAQADCPPGEELVVVGGVEQCVDVTTTTTTPPPTTTTTTTEACPEGFVFDEGEGGCVEDPAATTTTTTTAATTTTTTAATTTTTTAATTTTLAPVTTTTVGTTTTTTDGGVVFGANRKQVGTFLIGFAAAVIPAFAVALGVFMLGKWIGQQMRKTGVTRFIKSTVKMMFNAVVHGYTDKISPAIRRSVNWVIDGIGGFFNWGDPHKRARRQASYDAWQAMRAEKKAKRKAAREERRPEVEEAFYGISEEDWRAQKDQRKADRAASFEERKAEAEEAVYGISEEEWRAQKDQRKADRKANRKQRRAERRARRRG